MKLDNELFRKIILKAEEDLPADLKLNFEIPGVDDEVLQYHYRLIDEAGLMKFMTTKADDHVSRKPYNLTYNGHLVAEKMRDKKLWKTILQKIGKNAGSIITIVEFVISQSGKFPS
jgi:hypothetical protein